MEAGSEGESTDEDEKGTEESVDRRGSSCSTLICVESVVVLSLSSVRSVGRFGVDWEKRLAGMGRPLLWGGMLTCYCDQYRHRSKITC